MARVTRGREDLLAEATALAQRVELASPDLAEQVIVGFRRDGCGSVYFGHEEAYHFNTAGELRSAYRDGLLYKAERGGMVSLERQRESDQVVLVRHELDAKETGEFIQRIEAQLEMLDDALRQETARVVGQVPADVDVIARIRTWLGGLPPAAIAQSPHAR